MHFFVGQPGGLLQRLLDTFALEVWMVGEDFLNGCALSDLADNNRSRNPHSSDATAPPMIRGSNVIRSNIVRSFDNNITAV